MSVRAFTNRLVACLTAAITSAWCFGSPLRSSRLMPATPSASSRCAYSATSCGSSEKPCSASTLIGTGRWTSRSASSYVASFVAFAPSRTPIAAATPRLVVPIALNPAPPAPPPTRDPRRSAAAAGRRACGGQRTSRTPCASASACARPGHARRPSPNGRPVEADDDDVAVGVESFRRSHGQIIAADQRRRRLARLNEQRDVLRERLLVAGRQPVEQPPERFVGAGRVRFPGWYAAATVAHVGHDVAVDAGRARPHVLRHRHVLERHAPPAAPPRRPPPRSRSAVAARGRSARRAAARRRVERGQARLDHRAAAGVRLALGEPRHRGTQPRHRAERARRSGRRDGIVEHRPER